EVAAMSDIGERVKKIVVEHLGVEAEKVTENASFIDDLGADSLDTVELVMAFEEEFGCEIPDDAPETILTVGDAIKFLENNAKMWLPPGVGGPSRFVIGHCLGASRGRGNMLLALGRGVEDEAGCRHRAGHGDAACLRRRADLAASHKG